MEALLDVVQLKQAVNEGQLKFFVLTQYDGTYIYCKDNKSGETVCVGNVESNVKVYP